MRAPIALVAGALAAALVVALIAVSGGADEQAAKARWRPAPRTSFQYQLSGRIDTRVDAAVFDVDAIETPAATVRALRERGRRVVCYISAGSWERWRADARRYPRRLLGRGLDGWPGERWVDVRASAALAPVLDDRMERCAEKGFDGIEFDNVDGYANRTGFPLRAGDQLRFNRWLARRAHAHGLAAGLKNDPGQARALAPAFDFAVVEQCVQYDECEAFTPFTRAGRAVFDVEYRTPPAGACARLRRLGITLIRKRLDLGVPLVACPPA